MPSKKHLGSQARRFTRRGAVHLSEFLRGDDEPTSQDPSQLQQNGSQNTNKSSIGTIPSIDQTASYATVSPVVTPSMPSDDQEKVSPHPPATLPMNVWKLSPDGNDQPDGAFVPDKKEFPDLGKQFKKAKPLVKADLKKAAKSSNSSAQRGRIMDPPVLGNFLPESLLPEGATRKDHAVACWLSSVRSVDDNNQAVGDRDHGTKASPPKKINLLKKGPSQPQQTEKSPGCSAPQKVQMQHQISPEKPASSTSSCCRSVHNLEKSGPSQQKKQQETPDSPSKLKIQQQKMPGNHSPLQTKPMQQPISSEKPASSTASGDSAVAVPTLFQEDEKDVLSDLQFSIDNTQRSMAAARQRTSHSDNQSIWKENNGPSPGELAAREQAAEKHGSRGRQTQVLPQPLQDNQTSMHPIRRIPSISTRSMLNVNAQEFCPRARQQHYSVWGSTQQTQAQQPHPGEEFNRRGARLSKRRRRQRYLRSLKPESLLSLPSSGQVFGQGDESPGQEQGQSQQQTVIAIQGQPYGHGQEQEQSQASVHMPPCYYSAPALVSGRNHHQQQRPVTQTQLLPVSQLSRAYQAAPAPIYTAPTGQIPIVMQNVNASQSVFRMASLPSTGVGTTDSSTSHTDTSSINPLPSSITGPSHLSHTLSSAVGDYPDCHRHESNINQDLRYSRPLLDMDREDTQGENQGWGWQLESDLESQTEPRPTSESDHQPIDLDAEAGAVPLARNMIFRAPSKHGKDYPKPDLNCVPQSIKKLHCMITLQYSDYSFVYALSAQLGQECVPMDCYVYLKMVLLASIVSIEPDELRPPISLCIIATDSLMANRLMNSIGQLAPRFLGPHEYGLQPTIVGGALSSRYNWVVASPLLLAQQGVYYAGDWTRLSKEHSEQIEKCIENGAVPVPQLQSDQTLEAAIWMHWQPENSSNQSLAFAKLCPIFGLPIYMGDAQVSDSLWTFLLRQHTKEGQLDDQHDGLNIPEEDMRMLLHLLHQRKITFDDQAQHMLQKYYVISRKERPTVFTSKTYIVLKQFAESFAKLALRLEVLESDVCVAIFHCEHFVQQIFGAKDMSPPPVVNSFSVISHIDPYMNEFARWLLQYLDRYEDNELGMHKTKRRRTDSWSL